MTSVNRLVDCRPNEWKKLIIHMAKLHYILTDLADGFFWPWFFPPRGVVKGFTSHERNKSLRFHKTEMVKQRLEAILFFFGIC